MACPSVKAASVVLNSVSKYPIIFNPDIYILTYTVEPH